MISPVVGVVVAVEDVVGPTVVVVVVVVLWPPPSPPSPPAPPPPRSAAERSDLAGVSLKVPLPLPSAPPFA